MSVHKQKTSKGETKFYHYRFMSKGKNYSGVCKGCTTKKNALEYEREIKAKVHDLAKQKNVKALVENFREAMTGGSPVLLEEAFTLFLKKPSKRQPSPKVIMYKKSYWRDFVSYIKTRYPSVVKLADVRKVHAEEYIQYLRKNGRFDNKVSFKAGHKTATYEKKGNLSNRSINSFHQTIAEIFDKLSYDAGLIDNPFSGIPKLKNECESRETFTEQELELIRDKANDFIRPLFCIGIATALREGDICTLRWSNVDFNNRIVRRKMSKTGRVVEIPILPPLMSFLMEQKENVGNSDFVLPEHAQIYMKNPTGITMRVKKFLEEIGIKTTKKIKGRSRAVSIKDVHSLRHTFCYYAGVYGIPFLVVKDIVGHVSPQMTELYQRHADNRLKREKLLQMPDFMGLSSNSHIKEIPGYEVERDELKKLADLADINKIRKAIATLSE